MLSPPMYCCYFFPVFSLVVFVGLMNLDAYPSEFNNTKRFQQSLSYRFLARSLFFSSSNSFYFLSVFCPTPTLSNLSSSFFISSSTRPPAHYFNILNFFLLFLLLSPLLLVFSSPFSHLTLCFHRLRFLSLSFTFLFFFISFIQFFSSSSSSSSFSSSTIFFYHCRFDCLSSSISFESNTCSRKFVFFLSPFSFFFLFLSFFLSFNVNRFRKLLEVPQK
ncbi:unnamed protein product [Acanthosepion pharaonis]|uniref:Uncharacterized protein n=1 Tax=Acanthosepion pharaonis TaxID=158019 RepID=A0A812AMQ9_ACAPH|nr:unnamed protein product [Sepia pharaonis]